MPTTAATAAAPTYAIGDLAREFDLTTRAIRFYEDIGLLQPQRQGTGGRVRVYSARDRARLMLTLRAKRLGLSLGEARELLDMYDGPQDTVPQLRRLIELLAAHRAQLEGRLAELQANIDEVKARERKAKAQLSRAQRNPSNIET
ncbi:MerR family transcriptional regulator [Xylophilus rhododendri]|uniref:MerR family transcriptional regulator n=1 Tax=Xylophilus rhododendri TaxID=2697032 RepID=A0A857J8E0_9BURK|nr:MerR family DNA-binding transcriptional regulator [Xylophilus rhododendri]QHI99282.1 MerR family transcriptional regulator [Xylophilus rhododendri]